MAAAAPAAAAVVGAKRKRSSTTADDDNDDSKTVYKGTVSCSKEKCSNQAYYRIGDTFFCGTHSRNKKRVELPRMPASINAERHRKKMEAHEASIIAATKANADAKVPGKLSLFKMRMMKSPPLVPGYRNVFPNRLHGDRKDGLGLSKLSPKAMLDIVHGQPGLPSPASSLEHLHQGNKVYPFLADEKGNPTAGFYAVQKAMYLDRPHNPHRHMTGFLKTQPTLCEEHGIVIPDGKQKNAPLYSLWTLPDGKQQRVTYVESRQFYCSFYEQRALVMDEFKDLQARLARGENLILCGYDAYEPTRALNAHYLDGSRPFGHELVLYTLLTVKEKEQYPWRVFQTVFTPELGVRPTTSASPPRRPAAAAAAAAATDA
jgi:hypothetical protein